jgi:hypothetical protein
LQEQTETDNFSQGQGAEIAEKWPFHGGRNATAEDIPDRRRHRGLGGPGAKALEVIGKAEVLIGHQRHLDNFPTSREKRTLDDLSIMLDCLKGRTSWW